MSGSELEHRTVLLGEAVDALAIRPGGIYVDATFGRGGHSAAIVSRLGAGGRLIAIDRDPQAIAAARRWMERLADARIQVIQARFSQLGQVLDACEVSLADGVLLDLGVSSPQLDDPSRGFSFKEDGPLDMRMDPASGMSASQWLQEAPEELIATVLRDYGEERFAVSIAKAIVARRGQPGETGFRTTGQLARLVAGVVRGRSQGASSGKDPATRTFQALRIFINGELAELEAVLDVAVSRLRPGGRLAVISFHSLEDRMVKRFIERESERGVPRDPVTGARRTDARFRLIPVARVLPGPQEVSSNPRSRSAVLRVAERADDDMRLAA